MNYKALLARELTKEAVLHYIENKETYDKLGIPLDENWISSVMDMMNVDYNDEEAKRSIKSVLDLYDAGKIPSTTDDISNYHEIDKDI